MSFIKVRRNVEESQRTSTHLASDRGCWLMIPIKRTSKSDDTIDQWTRIELVTGNVEIITNREAMERTERCFNYEVTLQGSLVDSRHLVSVNGDSTVVTFNSSRDHAVLHDNRPRLVKVKSSLKITPSLESQQVEIGELLFINEKTGIAVIMSARQERMGHVRELAALRERYELVETDSIITIKG